MAKSYELATPCPNCGQQDYYDAWAGARQWSSSWGHNYTCCSEECGREFGKKLANSKKGERIRELKSKIAQLEMEIMELAYEVMHGNLD